MRGPANPRMKEAEGEGRKQRIKEFVLLPSLPPLLLSLLLVFFPPLRLRNLDTPTFEKIDTTELCSGAHILGCKNRSVLMWPGGSDGRASVCNEGKPGLIPRLGRSPGEGNGNPFQYSCLENSMDGGAWWATYMGSQRVVHG